MVARLEPQDLINRCVRVGDCFIWTGEVFNKMPYGKVTYQGKTQLVHRLMYKLFVGDIPDDLVLRHSCDNPRCCELSHLEPGTHQDNSDDCVNRSRQAKGESHGMVIVTRKQVTEIRDLLKCRLFTQARIAFFYDINRSLVSDIKSNRCWRD